VSAIPRRVVVVGASLAGLRAVEGLRAEGFDGELVVVGAEERLPYNRPPLSKELLAGRSDVEDVALQRVGDLRCEWVLGSAAKRLDLDARRVVLADHRELAFDGLILACGADARPLRRPPGPAEGVFMLRTLDDSLRLRAGMVGAGHVVIVGAGFIGCEVASTARSLGLDVTMVDVAASPMEPRVGEEVGRWAAELHRSHGVRLVLGTGVDTLEGADRLTAVRLADGTRIEADLAVVGLGSVPNTGWLAGSGLPLDDGIVCDATLAVHGVPGVVAAGDVARWPYGPVGGSVRVEHWSNAVEQGGWAARTLLHGGASGPFATLPSFWSDQHGARIQSLGLPAAAHRSLVVEGSPDEGRFVVLYARAGRLVGAIAVGLPRRLARLRRAVLGAEPFDAAVAHARSDT
jgi:3-phenylpropionate/trans-cinnamate dioxygenase ferredoxin reductase subunit